MNKETLLKKKFNKLFYVLVCFAMFLNFFGSSYRYVANKRSRVFHYVTCEWAEKITFSRRMYLNDRQQLISQGFRPCPSCLP